MSASANSGYQFGGFAGDVSGTTTPQTLTMTGPRSVTASFTAVPPVITSVTPTSGSAGVQVTISGSGFGATRGTGAVWLGRRLARW